MTFHWKSVQVKNDRIINLNNLMILHFRIVSEYIAKKIVVKERKKDG